MALVHGKMLLMILSLFLLAAATPLLAAAAADKLLPPQSKPNCPDHCGNLTIPYPFGIGDGCSIPLKGLENQYKLICDNSTEPPSLNWTNSRVRITNFSLAEGELQVMNDISKDCYNKLGGQVLNTNPWLYMNPPFTISGAKNKFIAVGCDTSAVLRGFRGEEEFITGCMSVCNNISAVDQNSCSGVGCCKTDIPDGLKNRTVRLGSYYNHMGIWEFNPCSYAFIVQDGHFEFNSTSFQQLENIEQLPMIFNWQIGNETCDVAKKSTVDYVCQANTMCVNQSKGPRSGYYCQCLPGYEGNPYLGCQGDLLICRYRSNIFRIYIVFFLNFFRSFRC